MSTAFILSSLIFMFQAQLKKKALDCLRHSAPIAETTASKALYDDAKIVKDFNNQTLSIKINAKLTKPLSLSACNLILHCNGGRLSIITENRPYAHASIVLATLASIRCRTV